MTIQTGDNLILQAAFNPPYQDPKRRGERIASDTAQQGAPRFAQRGRPAIILADGEGAE